jgi:hypothetical protein
MVEASRLISIGIVVAILALAITVFWIATSVSSVAEELRKLREEQNKTSNEIAELRSELAELANKTAYSNNPILVDVSELTSNPTAYQGKLLTVIGEFHSIVTVPEIKLPYNAVIVSESSQIGVDIEPSKAVGLEGSKVLVTGFLMQGTKKELGSEGWVDAGSVRYIEAIEAKKI